jgi:hypothetical protein
MRANPNSVCAARLYESRRSISLCLFPAGHVDDPTPGAQRHSWDHAAVSYSLTPQRVPVSARATAQPLGPLSWDGAPREQRRGPRQMFAALWRMIAV